MFFPSSPFSGFPLQAPTPAGQLDTTFGTNGTVVTSLASGNHLPAVSANGLTIQPADSKIVVVGSYSVSVPHQGFDVAFKVLRYLGE